MRTAWVCVTPAPPRAAVRVLGPPLLSRPRRPSRTHRSPGRPKCEAARLPRCPQLEPAPLAFLPEAAVGPAPARPLPQAASGTKRPQVGNKSPPRPPSPPQALHLVPVLRARAGQHLLHHRFWGRVHVTSPDKSPKLYGVPGP